MKAKEVAEIFLAMNPDDEVWFNYLTKDDVLDNFLEQEVTDKEGNQVDTEQFVTNEALQSIGQSLDNDEHIWQVFNESFGDYCNHKLERLVEEAEEDKELWDSPIGGAEIKGD